MKHARKQTQQDKTGSVPGIGKASLASIVPQRSVRISSVRADEAHDEEIMNSLLYPDERPGQESGTDESLNDGNSALSENPSNGRWPKDAALD